MYTFISFCISSEVGWCTMNHINAVRLFLCGHVFYRNQCIMNALREPMFRKRYKQVVECSWKLEGGNQKTMRVGNGDGGLKATAGISMEYIQPLKLPNCRKMMPVNNELKMKKKINHASIFMSGIQKIK